MIGNVDESDRAVASRRVVIAASHMDRSVEGITVFAESIYVQSASRGACEVTEAAVR